MCVIVHQPKGAHIDKETCRKLWKANPDGGGFAFINDDGQVDITKAMDFKSFWSEFEQARSANVGKEFMLHMRIATHGSVKIENVHPFVVDEHTVMAHNGIIHGVPDYKDDDRTDTEVFISEVLPELPDGWQDMWYMSQMVEEWIGWSKLMFITTSLTLDQDIYRLGDWDEYKGLFLTNLTGLEKPKKKVTTAYHNLGPGTYYSESSRDWNEWVDWEDSRNTAWEEEQFESMLVAERKTQLINQPVIDVRDGYECYGCNTIIDPETAECACWENVCGECWDFIARCTTEGDCLTATQYVYQNLNKEDQERVSDTNRQTNQNKELATVIDIMGYRSF